MKEISTAKKAIQVHRFGPSLLVNIVFAGDSLRKLSTIHCETGSDPLPHQTLRASGNTVLQMLGGRPCDPNLQRNSHMLSVWWLT